MGRLIDANLLTKQFMTRYTEQEKQGNFTFVACEIKSNFRSMMDEMPTVDAVPVVRCQDCKHWEVHMANPTEYISWCELVGRTAKPCDFCSWGEVREDV